ncbi:hypothetical protein [Massilia sp.]|nr:hypothetical protein [Massilia sp.]
MQMSMTSGQRAHLTYTTQTERFDQKYSERIVPIGFLPVHAI